MTLGGKIATLLRVPVSIYDHERSQEDFHEIGRTNSFKWWFLKGVYGLYETNNKVNKTIGCAAALNFFQTFNQHGILKNFHKTIEEMKDTTQ